MAPGSCSERNMRDARRDLDAFNRRDGSGRSGVEAFVPGARNVMPVETDPALNLLVDRDGAERVALLRARTAARDGGARTTGQLLLVALCACAALRPMSGISAPPRYGTG